MATAGAGLAPEPAFWSGRRVLVTGHTGFKGSWLVVWLNRLGARVSGYSLAPPSQPALFEALGLDQHCDHRSGDVADSRALAAAFRAGQPEIVIHLAAQALVRRGYRSPLDTFGTNVIGTAAVLEACRAAGSVRTCLVVTSDKCYADVPGVVAPHGEADRLGGHDPYSASKACAELVTDCYRASYFGAAAGSPPPAIICSARSGNVLGGGDWGEDRILADAARAFAAGRSLIVRNPAAVRPWQHVVEPLAGYLMLIRAAWERGAGFARSYNFGPPMARGVTVAELVGGFAAAWGGGAAWHAEPVQDGCHETAILRLDAAAAARDLGWCPTAPLAGLLQTTADWYRAFYQGASRQQLTAMMLDTIGQLAPTVLVPDFQDRSP